MRNGEGRGCVPGTLMQNERGAKARGRITKRKEGLKDHLLGGRVETGVGFRGGNLKEAKVWVAGISHKWAGAGKFHVRCYQTVEKGREGEEDYETSR